MEPSPTNNPEKPSEIYVEKDVLGLEKPNMNAAPKAKPARLFIGLLLVIIGIAIVCFLMAK